MGFKHELTGPLEHGFFYTETAGHPQERLRIEPGISRCGDITDGVSFEHGNQGCWLISFAALEQIYLEAKKARS